MEKLNIKEFLDQDEKKDLLRLLTAGSVDDGKSTLISWMPSKGIPNVTVMQETISIMPSCSTA